MRELQKQLPAPLEQTRELDPLRESALGLVSTRSFPAIVGTADMMVKSAGVTLVGYEKIGSGYCTAIVRGKIADVRIAVEAGADTAEQFGQLISKVVLARPLPNLDAILPIGTRWNEMVQGNSYSRLSNLAIGLLETRGFPAMVGAADAMLKSADVQLAAYETIGDGLCTVIIRGSVADVAVAVEAGMYEAERIGDFNSLMVIPRPLEDLEKTLPVASCWIEQHKPLLMPINVKEKEKQAEKELVELPDLAKLPASNDAEKELVELPELKELPKQKEQQADP
ncbi:BMC domain-containing protein [Microcoleus sp. FACHB-672]|uniref:BMC domain-containing protein n=1 Tax=Microcoleus sp. FACHB-672 TaxID=2692825 RepID=UPI001682AE97|nr:BMC domain-containing protein [Microcoleus sp. FACHB-672]MBD2042427.1 BMC domain-containing protein [Microcoleus sp. FACHB-672]